MNYNNFKTAVQNFFQEGTIIIVGSGLSIAEGIPGMYDLANMLKEEMPLILNKCEDKRIWEKIVFCIDEGKGLEEALHIVKPTMLIEEKIREITANLIGDYDNKVLNEMVSNQRKLIFSTFLDYFNIRNDGLVVITTNYDRLVEYACEFNGLMIDTSFVGDYISLFNPSRSKFHFCEGIKKVGKATKPVFASKVKVLKPHGCLSWYLIGDKVYSISNKLNSVPLIITPGLNKYREGYNIPFDSHRNMANNAIDSADKFIIIGYGFNDDHLETHLIKQLQKNKPALILSKGISDKIDHYAKMNRNLIAISSFDKKNGSKIIFNGEEIIMENINLWDVSEMLKEVF